ncbi:hypothetical protein KKB18_07380 [bacterium]|nr:hypothetical protein [bacterium]
MNTSNKRIDLFEIFKTTSLITRQAARIINEMILEFPEIDIVLNFENIKNSSLSFFDELNSSIFNLKNQGKNIILENMNEDLVKLFEVIKKRTDSLKNIKPESVLPPKVTKI